ncbi:MAG TPA: response regulator transcription factor [Solirubrobacteraceae bacterium]|nr:response regulator transcription factor [Solirubrobacteraceae bacterium]
MLVLDDEDIVQCGFRLLLANQQWAERCVAARGEREALELAQRYGPHVALVDVGALRMPPDAFCRALGEVSAHTRVLLLTSASAMPASTVRAYGAAGYVSRTWSARDLLAAIRMASAGRACPPRASAQQRSLSARQEEILQLIAAGATNAEIAGRLYLSRHTVKQHTSALYRKLNVRNRTHAVQAAQRAGLIPV